MPAKRKQSSLKKTKNTTTYGNGGSKRSKRKQANRISESNANKKAQEYQRFKNVADGFFGTTGTIIDPKKYPNVDRDPMIKYNLANTVNKMNPMKFFREGAETRKAKMLKSAS
jgi:hypothetical protein